MGQHAEQWSAPPHDRYTGLAEVVYDDDSVFRGSLFHGRRHGSGQWCGGTKSGSATTRRCYDGQWRDDERNGNGEYHEFRAGGGKRGVGFSYRGLWRDDQPNDPKKGRLVTRRRMILGEEARRGETVLVKTTFEGAVVNGVMEGFGVLTRERIQGDEEEDEDNDQEEGGLGERYSPPMMSPGDDEVLEEDHEDPGRYVGWFGEGGLKHGQGTFTSDFLVVGAGAGAGERQWTYDGAWRAGRRHGYGEMVDVTTTTTTTTTMTGRRQPSSSRSERPFPKPSYAGLPRFL